jgi:hypothetical protein
VVPPKKSSGLAIALGAAPEAPQANSPPAAPASAAPAAPPTPPRAEPDGAEPIIVRVAGAGTVHAVHLHAAATIQELKEALQRTETAGFVPAKDQILLIGALDQASNGPHNHFSSLLKGPENAEEAESAAAAPLPHPPPSSNVGPFVRMSTAGGRTVRSYPPLTDPNASHRTVIYMFDRRVLSSRAQAPQMIVLEPQHVPIPSEVQAVGGARGTPHAQTPSNGDPLLAAVVAAERQFRLHLQQARAWRKGGYARLASCAECLHQLNVQVEALDAAVDNLGSFFKSIAKDFRAFWEKTVAQRRKDAGVLASFPENLNFLKRMRIHKNLARDGKETLYDCCPVERLQQWAADCQRLDRGLDQKVEHLNALFQSVQASVGAEVNGRGRAKFLGPLDELTQQLLAVQASVEAVVRDSVAVLEGRHGKLQAVLVAKGENIDLLTIVQDLGKMREDHLNNILPSLAREMDDKLMGLMDQCADLKNEAALAQFQGLKKVSKLQAMVSELKQKQASLQEVLRAQHTRVAQLLPMEKMPSAYAACLAEVARRRAHRAMVIAEVRAVSKKMNKLRSEEIERREAFLRRHGCYLPADLVPGLSNPRPAAVEIGLRSTSQDEALPDVDVDDAAASLYEDLGLADLLKSAKSEYHHDAKKYNHLLHATADAPAAGTDGSQQPETVDSLHFANAKLRAELLSRFALSLSLHSSTSSSSSSSRSESSNQGSGTGRTKRSVSVSAIPPPPNGGSA